MTTQKNTNTKAAPAKKNLFGLSGTQLNTVVGGSGIIIGPPRP